MFAQALVIERMFGGVYLYKATNNNPLKLLQDDDNSTYRHVCLALPERSACSGGAAWPFAVADSDSIVTKSVGSGCKRGMRKGSVVNVGVDVDVSVSVDAEVRGKTKGVAAQF